MGDMPNDSGNRLEPVWYVPPMVNRSDSLKITVELVKELIREQFPQWAALPIRAVQPGGHDNRTFRLGECLAVRLPSHPRYEAQVEKEARFLPYLASHLSVPITAPEAVGQPTDKYPLVWSVNRWLPGQTAQEIHDGQKPLAVGLAKFLQELWAVSANAGPPAGQHNFHRGGDLGVYHEETLAALAELGDRVNQDACRRIWQRSLASQWDRPSVWIHGDVAPGNLLVDQTGLIGVIDFGCMGVGDPACDLVMAWTYFADAGRELFRNSLEIDSETWNRARGWALWKALITFHQPGSSAVVRTLVADESARS